jgi:putative tryptophan/tyrosine transport system substrate-binding protein
MRPAEISSKHSHIAYLTTSAEWDSTSLGDPVRENAEHLGVTIIPALLESPITDNEFRRAFHLTKQQAANAVVVGSAQENYPRQKLIIRLAEEYGLPAIYPERSFVEQGGLLSYGPKLIACTEMVEIRRGREVVIGQVR